jgi:serine/threonine-protein kinase
MPIETVVSFLDALRDSQLLSGERLAQLESEAPDKFEQPKALAKELITRGWLTLFQARQIFVGRGGELTLGPYRLLEKLGEGGMGQVYKAMHVAMHRVVALKVIRSEMVAEPRALKRFRREVQAAAQLSHPNIVTVFDAAEIGSTCFLAMEYIDGADLTDLAHQRGPLPVEAACDYIRQAAAGLQHAHDRGFIHRDIKPANLLVTRAPRAGVVKILDMGLARPANVNLNAALNQSSLTVEGTVVGTPDFMSPEQAKNSRTMDHRADLYSLGCTLYYVLTGQPPFPNGNAMEKLFKHQLEEPPAVESVRKDLPRGLAAVVRKMMAKSPDDRHQSGNKVAAALAPFCEPGSLQPAVDDAGPPVVYPLVALSSPSTESSSAFHFDTSESPRIGSANRVGKSAAGRSAILLVAGVVAAMLGFIGLILLFILVVTRQ